jgi:hypothetical protein
LIARSSTGAVAVSILPAIEMIVEPSCILVDISTIIPHNRLMMIPVLSRSNISAKKDNAIP